MHIYTYNNKYNYITIYILFGRGAFHSGTIHWMTPLLPPGGGRNIGSGIQICIRLYSRGRNPTEYGQMIQQRTTHVKCIVVGGKCVQSLCHKCMSTGKAHINGAHRAGGRGHFKARLASTGSLFRIPLLGASAGFLLEGTQSHNTVAWHQNVQRRRVVNEGENLHTLEVARPGLPRSKHG